MPRAEKGSAKALANKVKSKGLQKLKWFCQMCNKQCRDQNGFKCHLTSESHQRQLLLFAENQNSYLREFSQEFESSFMRILRHTYGTKRVRANEVYQDVIKDKGHVHMNSTVWHTLTGFVMYLGSSGKCKIDQGEKGWYIQYIDQEEEIRRNKLLARARKEKDAEEREAELLERQIQRAKERDPGDSDESDVDRDLVRTDPEQKVTISLAPQVQEEDKSVLERSKAFSERKSKRSATDSSSGPSSSKKSTLEKMMEDEERYKERKNRTDNWLTEGIVVKIVTKKLGSKYYKAKGQVIGLTGKYTAKVDVDGDILKLDQNHLETVIPAVGKDMLIINGAYRGYTAVLLKIREKDYSVDLRLKEGLRSGREITVAYEDASKIA